MTSCWENKEQYGLVPTGMSEFGVKWDIENQVFMYARKKNFQWFFFCNIFDYSFC